MHLIQMHLINALPALNPKWLHLIYNTATDWNAVYYSLSGWLHIL